MSRDHYGRSYKRKSCDDGGDGVRKVSSNSLGNQKYEKMVEKKYRPSWMYLRERQRDERLLKIYSAELELTRICVGTNNLEIAFVVSNTIHMKSWFDDKRNLAVTEVPWYSTKDVMAWYKEEYGDQPNELLEEIKKLTDKSKRNKYIAPMTEFGQFRMLTRISDRYTHKKYEITKKNIFEAGMKGPLSSSAHCMERPIEERRRVVMTVNEKNFEDRGGVVKVLNMCLNKFDAPWY